MAFTVLDQAERFVAKIELPEDYALAPAIATARGEFRRLREALDEIDVFIRDLAYPGPETNWIHAIVRVALTGEESS
jgi:hypothetical protein